MLVAYAKYTKSITSSEAHYSYQNDCFFMFLPLLHLSAKELRQAMNLKGS